MDTVTQLVLLSLAAGTPLVFAALGELVVEKSGVLNLGVEGMMLVGAVVAFIVAATTKSPWLGVLAGMFAGSALALAFAVVTLTLQANQVASGLALSLFGVGLSAFIGRGSSIDVPVRELPDYYARLKAPPGKTDVLFLTDARVRLPADVRATFVAWKQSVQARLITLVVGTEPGDLAAISDEVHVVRSLDVGEEAVGRAVSIWVGSRSLSTTLFPAVPRSV